MSQSLFVGLLSYLEPILCLLVLISLARAGMARKFIFLTALLTVRLVSGLACLVILQFAARGIERHLAYQIYFYVYWSAMQWSLSWP